jgi:large subunit ribosomal protein L29
MVLLKCKEIRTWSQEDRQKRLKDLRSDLMREMGIAAMGGAPISPGKIRAVRTNIARILTIESEIKNKEKASSKKVKKEPEEKNK